MSNNNRQDDDNFWKDRIEEAYKLTSDVSPTMCVAKWKQVTMHLHNGHTHSCHHPMTHIVPIEELKRNKTALHNTEFKKQQRKLMLEGQRPAECDYCWKVEDAGNKYSDRIYKSADTSWAMPHITAMGKLPWTADVDPSYVEVSFSSVCNFKCSYCSPNISSQWMEEIERYGAYPTSGKFNNLDWFKIQKQMPIPNNQDNPYVDAFWEWWPQMYKSLKQFRITGGEPLLTKNTFKVLDYILDNPNPDLVFSVNSNLNAPGDLMDRFIATMSRIEPGKHIKRFQLFTSAEAHGAQAEYIRFGMNYQRWLNNMERMIREVPGVETTIMSTYNLLSVPSYERFLQDILNIRLKYRDQGLKYHKAPVLVDIPYLRWPEHQACYIMPEELLHYVEQQVKFMEDHAEQGHIDYTKAFMGFHDHEIYKLKRLYNVIVEALRNPDPNLNVKRRDFVAFVDEHDRRRKTDFLTTYPELESMYLEWKKL